jgi:alpha-tubulin suppressor-like RCC1 family protein
MVYGVFVPGEQAAGTHEELTTFAELTLISTGQMLYGGHSLPAISFCPETNMFLIVWVTNRHVDSGEIFARYLPSRAFVPPSATSYLERLDTGDFVNLVDVSCGANTGQLSNDRRTGDCLVTWTLRHDNAFWSFGRQITIVASPIAQLLGHATGFYGPLHNLGALSAWGTEEPAIGVADGPENFCSAFIGLDGSGVKHAFSRMSITPAGWSVVAAGGTHSLGIRSDGSLWAWGWNHSGQLGIGDNRDRNTPVRVGIANDWRVVRSGYFHSLGIRTDGSLWAWGWNLYGQLGTGGVYAGKNTPTRVGSLSNWIAVSAGYDHSLGIRTDGSLWAWGKNDKYQLGLGDTNDRNIPVRVGSFNDWMAVAAGTHCSFGIRLNGSLWSWGENTHGQLGMGDHYPSLIPTQVGSSNNWVAVRAGFDHSLGIRTDGSLYSWGNNQLGQLGLNDSQERAVPTRIGISKDWFTMAAGSGFSLGLLSHDTTHTSLWSWGHNNWGQLGIGNNVSKQVPTEITGISGNCISISSGGNSSFCIRSDGSLWAWGGNLNGQLGVGDNEDRNAPFQVFLSKNKKFPWPMFLPGIINGHN